MHRHLLYILLATGGLAQFLPAQTPSHLGAIRQLTNGGENAEAYWSPDGQRIIFQSTRDQLQCDQIFIMNRDGGNLHMVSTGKGRTTCGYFLPDNKHILYASTHEAGDACPPAADRSKGYVWAVYPTYKIYLATDDGKILKTLAGAPGYNAEGTVNLKTGRIVYTSMASGDLDLWTMKPDGSDKKQITKTDGYDGGPGVFARRQADRVARESSADAGNGQALSRFAERESDVADEDGAVRWRMATERTRKQITNFGCASFAPTFTPDGKKILFASNKHDCDGRKFELYLVNVDGIGSGTGDGFRRFHGFPRVCAGWKDDRVRVGQGRQVAVRIQYIHGRRGSSRGAIGRPIQRNLAHRDRNSGVLVESSFLKNTPVYERYPGRLSPNCRLHSYDVRKLRCSHALVS